MPLFARDESRPGRPLLMFGLAAFILAALGGLALLWGQPSLASKLIAELMLALFQAVIVIVSIVLGMLILAVLSGVPTLSVDHVGRAVLEDDFWCCPLDERDQGDTGYRARSGFVKDMIDPIFSR